MITSRVITAFILHCGDRNGTAPSVQLCACPQTAVVLPLLAAIGCSGSPEASIADDQEQSEDELGGFAGSTLKSKDQALTLKFEMLDGVQAATKKNRYTKVSMTRSGNLDSNFRS